MHFPFSHNFLKAKRSIKKIQVIILDRCRIARLSGVAYRLATVRQAAGQQKWSKSIYVAWTFLSVFRSEQHCAVFTIVYYIDFGCNYLC